ncbi:MAG: hypothetical protein M3O35_09415 [Acidobacteriota bacterium]|nr:hypothetical protein [Acidobacteriota bacterium]
MKGRLYAEFMERRGRRIFEGAGCYWYDVSGGMLMGIPYHEPIDPSAEEMKDLLSRAKRIGARYLSGEGNGLRGGLYLRRKSPYDITSVHRKSRNRLRHAIEKCVVRPVERSEFREQGMQLNLDTMARQGRFDAEFGEPRQWERLVQAAYSSPGVAVMGAFAEGALAAYSVTLKEEGWFHILHQFSGNAWLSDWFPNEAVTFGLTKAAMDDPEMDAVSYGVAGLVKGAGLHEYKLRHGYEFAPYGYAFALHPAASWLLSNPASAWGIAAAHGLFPRVQVLERMESVVKGARLTSAKQTPASAMAEELRHG